MIELYDMTAACRALKIAQCAMARLSLRTMYAAVNADTIVFKWL